MQQHPQNSQNPDQPQAMYPHSPQEQASFIPPQPQQMYVPQQPYQQQPLQQMPYAQSMATQQPYPQPAPYPQQQMMMPPQIMQSNVNISVNNGKQRGFLSRALYFCFIGWWLGFAWLNIGYFCVLTVVLLPIGLIMLNRLPQVITLRPSSGTSTNVNVSTTMVAGGMGGPVMVNNVNVNIGGVQQTSVLIRALYFCAIGWWAGYIWACTGYALVCFIVTMPLGLMMLNRLPAVLTLRKN